MLSAFTRAEKNILVFLVGALGLGGVAMNWYADNSRSAVFAQNAKAASAQTTPSPHAANASPSVSGSGATRPAPTPQRIVPLPAGGALDLNTASEAQLESLPGIGPSKAAAIARTRQQMGGFKSVGDLDQVPGIGPATVARLAPHVTVGGAAPSASVAAPSDNKAAPVPSPAQTRDPKANAMAFGGTPTPPRPASSPAAAISASPPKNTAPASPGFTRVAINTATAAQLETLPRIGPAMAKRIIEHRTVHGPFTSAEKLLDVKGIGEKTLDGLRPYISVP